MAAVFNGGLSMERIRIVVAYDLCILQKKRRSRRNPLYSAFTTNHNYNLYI
jgi:hypothetical protein